MVPAATSNTAAVNQTRRGLLIGPTLSTLMPNGKEDWGTVVTSTGYEPSKTPLTIPEINNRLRRTFEVPHQYYSAIAKFWATPKGPSPFSRSARPLRPEAFKRDGTDPGILRCIAFRACLYALGC